MTMSPLIKDGALALSSTGDLVSAPDIVTQMTVAIAAYHCIYDNAVNSELIPYLNSIPVGGFKRNTIVNIVVAAYKSMIASKIISNLQVAVLSETLSTVVIKVNATDANNNTAQLSWSNVV